MHASTTTGTGRWNAIAIGLLLFASAAAPLIFRFFITLDGPIHVLHAAVIEQHWTTPRFVSDGIAYNTAYLDLQLGDLVLMVLLHLGTPENAHDLFAVIACLAVIASAIALLRAQGVRMSAPLLWLAPVVFSFLLITGFFHFLLGVAVCLFTVAWWWSRHEKPLPRWTGTVVGAAIAWCTHRGAVPLLAVILAVLVMAELFTAAGRTWTERRRALLAMALLAGIAAWSWTGVLENAAFGEPAKPKVYSDLFLLRPLLLLDRTEEHWALVTLGGLLSLSIIAGLIARLRLGRKVLAHDALLVLALLFTLLPLVYESRKTRLFFVGERCQWLALLMLALWLASIAHAQRGALSRVIAITAIGMLPVQFFRVLQVEKAMALLRDPHDRMLEAAARLGEGSTVVPVFCETNWLLQHMGAFAAIRHNGIFLTRQEHLHFIFEDPPIPAVKAYMLRMTADRWWLPRHWVSGKKPVVAHVFFIGGDAHQRALWMGPWKKMIDRRYWLTFDNGYATVYTADPKGVKGMD